MSIHYDSDVAFTKSPPKIISKFDLCCAATSKDRGRHLYVGPGHIFRLVMSHNVPYKLLSAQFYKGEEHTRLNPPNPPFFTSRYGVQKVDKGAK